MKKYILPSLIAVVAISLPLMAQAQTSPILGTQQQSQSAAPYAGQAGQSSPSAGSSVNAPSDQQQSQMTSPAAGVSSQQTPTTQNSSQTSQMTTPNTGVSSQQQTVTQSQSAVTQSQSTTTTQSATAVAPPSVAEVIVGADAASSITPPLNIGLGTTAINVVNPTPKPVTFTVPNLSLSYEVPANSQRMVQIDPTQTANLTAGQSVAYYINDSNGNQIASGNLNNYQAIASQINTNTQFAYEQKEEPKYEATSTPRKYSRSRSTVRGYW